MAGAAAATKAAAAAALEKNSRRPFSAWSAVVDAGLALGATKAAAVLKKTKKRRKFYVRIESPDTIY